MNNSSGGLGLPVILFLIFLVLKLVNQISWSWWWVTSPLWIVLIIAIVLNIIAEIVKAKMCIKK